MTPFTINVHCAHRSHSLFHLSLSALSWHRHQLVLPYSTARSGRTSKHLRESPWPRTPPFVGAAFGTPPALLFKLQSWVFARPTAVDSQTHRQTDKQQPARPESEDSVRLYYMLATDTFHGVSSCRSSSCSVFFFCGASSETFCEINIT